MKGDVFKVERVPGGFVIVLNGRLMHGIRGLMDVWPTRASAERVLSRWKKAHREGNDRVLREESGHDPL